MTKKLIGLSLSLCVKEIIEGRVSLSDVEKISSGTFFTDRDVYHTGMKHGYGPTYWRKDPDLGHAIAMYLWDQRRLEQPRCKGKDPLPIHDGIWQEVEVT